MRIRIYLLLLLCVPGLPLRVSAQTSLPALPLANLSLPGNWQQVGPIRVDPAKPGLKTSPGNAALTGQPGKSLTLITPTADFMLQADLLTSPGAVPELTLPNGHTIRLLSSRAEKLPGLWQRVSLTYLAPVAGRPATLSKHTLNGVTLTEGLLLPMTRQAGQPLLLETQGGVIAIKNIGFQALNTRNIANWAEPVRYQLYKGSMETREGLTGKTPSATDVLPAIDYNAAYGQPGRITLVFDGKLNISDPGTYTFDLHYGGVAGLWIDGKPVVAMTYHALGDPESRSIALEAGTHDVQVQFTKSWARPGLGLFISQAGTRPQALHTDGSIPEIVPVSVVAVQAEAWPTLIRSFIQVPGETHKRTHALSVGHRAGLHYSVDLNQMALLMAWKGDFADVTQLWYERGEPQLLQPMGAAIRPSPRPALALLPDQNAPWPDSLDDNILIYKGLMLDKAGAPTAEYTLAGLTVRDQISPLGAGLGRTLTVSRSNVPGTLYCYLAGAASIEEVSKGLYAIDDRSYYVRLDPKAGALIRQNRGKQELILPVRPVNGSATVTYSLEF